MYTHSLGDSCAVEPPNRSRNCGYCEKRSENFGERKRRFQEFRDSTVSQKAQWAEREFVHAHIKAEARLDALTWQRLQMLLGLDDWGGECWKHACHAGTRRKLANKLARVITREVRRSGRQAYFITIIHDDWRSPIRRPVVPLTAIRQKGRDCLKFLGFEGFAGIEFDAITRALCNPEGHLLAPHLHAIGFLSTGARGKLKELRKSRRLRSEWGARTVVCKELRTLRDVRRAAAYIVKPPLWTKRPVPRRNRPTFTLVANRTRQTFLLARLAETLSYFAFKDLMLTCGKKSSWMTEAVRLASSSADKRERWLSATELDRLWRDYWLAYRRPHFEPVKVT
jgi:hypothetical protein